MNWNGSSRTDVRPLDVLSRPDLFQLVVPTRDSARRLPSFLLAYRSLGLRPLYMLDSRSTDDTAAVLRAAGADVVAVEPEVDRVEGMIGFIATMCRGTRWVLRLDDDEFPSAAMLAWIAANLGDTTRAIISFPRWPCLVGDDGVPCYATVEPFFWRWERPDLCDPQPRLFRPDRVSYGNTAIHSPGFDIAAEGFAPAAAQFCHFDWVVRTAAERIAKIRDYEAQSAGAGLEYLHQYLPEAATPGRYRRLKIEDPGIAALARRLSEERLTRLLGPCPISPGPISPCPISP